MYIWFGTGLTVHVKRPVGLKIWLCISTPCMPLGFCSKVYLLNQTPQPSLFLGSDGH